jgi:ATP-dependent Lon protease
MDKQNSLSEIEKLTSRLQSANLPANLKEKVEEQIERLNLALKYTGNVSQIDIVSKYVDWITNLPWDKKTEDVLDIQKAKEILDKNHFGLEKVKARVIEYLSVLILHKQKNINEPFHAPSLFFVGLPGTGKTTFAISVAEALGRKLVRIPFGGLSSALDLRGQSKTQPEAEPGVVIRSLRRVGVKNPVILLDELDRVTPEARPAVMGVLLELLDPNQNVAFTDYFIDYPFNLSEAIFIASANNTRDVSTAVLDRLEVIQMPSYTDQEKITIAKNYVFPRYIKEVGLSADLIQIDENVWSKVTRPLGFDPGMRTLERTVQQIVRRVAYKIVSGNPGPFVINEENLREYIQ